MKIYFAGSIRGGREDAALYLELITALGSFGEVLTEHIGQKDLSAAGETKTADFICNRDKKWIKDADVIIAEVTQPSLGVGYEIGYAESLGKRILCLYREFPGKSLSAMVAGNPHVQVRYYSGIEEAQNIFQEFFQEN